MRFKDFVGRVLQVRPEEWPATRLAVAFAFLTLFTAVLSRTVADALFLSTFDASWVPAYIAAGALGSVVFSAIYLGIVRRGRAGAKRNSVTLAVLAIAAVAASTFGMAGSRVGIWIFGVGMVLIGPAVNTVAWNAIAAIFHSRQSKRLLPLVGGAGTLGAIAAGLGIRPLIGAFGTTALVLPAALVFVILIPLPLWAASLSPEETSPAPKRAFFESLLGGFKALKETPLVASLAGITFLLAAATNFVDVQFLTALKQMPNTDDIGMFLGSFSAATNGALFIVQTFVLGRIFARFGVRMTFLVYPAVLLAGAGFVGIWPLFYAVAAYRGVDKVLKFAGHYGGIDLILSPVRDEIRDRARAFLRGACNPGGAFLAGIIATPVASLASPRVAQVITAVAIGLVCIAALWLAVRLRQQYLDELRKALRIREVRLEATPMLKLGIEGDVARLLTEAIDSGDSYLSEFALDILAANLEDPDMLARLLKHRDKAVRKAALEAAAARPRGLGKTVLQYVAEGREQEPAVLAAGLRALRASLGYWPGGTPETLLAHESVDVRIPALLLAVASGDQGAAERLEETLRTWVAGPPDDRKAAARLLGGLVEAGELGDRRPLLDGLLADEDPEVKLEAVSAAGGIADQRNVARLITLLDDRRVRSAAEDALGRLGVLAVDPLLKAAKDDEEDLALRHSAVQALSRIRHVPAVHAVAELLLLHEPDMRTQAAAAVRTLRRHLGESAVPRRRLLEAMHSELEGGYRAAGLWAERLKGGLGLEALLADGLQNRIDSATEALFGLAGALHGADWVEHALARYRSGSARTQADAVEVLEVVMQDTQSRAMLDYLDRASNEGKARHAPEFLGLDAKATFTEAVLNGPDRYLALCLVRAGLPPGAKAPPELVQEVEEMGEQFERVLLLKSVSLFSELSGEDLLPVAEVAKDVVVEPGAEIVTQGDAGDDLFVVVRGKVNVLKDGIAIGEIGDRGCFGELAVLDREPRAATCTAIARCEMLRIGRQEFNDLMDAHPGLTRGILKVLLGYVRAGRAQPAPKEVES